MTSMPGAATDVAQAIERGAREVSTRPEEKSLTDDAI